MRTKRPAFVVVFAATAAIAAIACGSGSSDRQCSSGADCASGACNADGTCVVTSTGGSDSGAITTDDSGSKPVVDASYTVDASSLACSQNTDDGGTLGHDNVPLAAGLSATFLVAQNETISTAGILNADGSRTWDFSGSLASDQKVIVQTLSPSGQWWSGDFATATYASKLQSSSDLLGIFDYAADSLKLPGVASPTSTTPKTEISYDPPATILAFPLVNGKTWTSTSTVSGTLSGVFSNYTEKYESSVDAYGTLKTPYGTFPVLRVSTLLTDLQGLTPFKTSRTYAWVTACFGTVAKATSQNNDTSVDFSDAAELERLTK